MGAPRPDRANPAGGPAPAVSDRASAPTAVTVPPAPVTIRHGDIRINSAAGIYLAVERAYFAEPAIDLTDFYVFPSPSRPVRDGLVGRPG